MKRFWTENILNQTSRFNLSRGKYLGLFIIADGTNQAGQTLSNADLGIIQLIKNGVQKSNVDFDVLQQSHNSLDMGAVENVSVAGAAFRISAFLPFTHWKDGVALDVQDDNEWSIMHTFPQCVAGIITAGTIGYFGLKCDDVDLSEYELQIINHHFSIAAAGVHSFPIHIENVHSIYIEKDPNISHLSLMKDGQPFYDQVSMSDINTETNLTTETETYGAAQPFLKLHLNPNDEEVGSFAKEIQLTLTATGVCTVKCMVISQFATPDRLLRSVTNRNIKIEQKLTKPGVSNSVVSLIKSKRVEEK